MKRKLEETEDHVKRSRVALETYIHGILPSLYVVMQNNIQHTFESDVYVGSSRHHLKIQIVPRNEAQVLVTIYLDGKPRFANVFFSHQLDKIKEFLRYLKSEV